MRGVSLLAWDWQGVDGRQRHSRHLLDNLWVTLHVTCCGMSRTNGLGEHNARPAKARGWLERCCTTRRLSRPESLMLQLDDSEEARPQRYRALFPSPSATGGRSDAVADVVRQCGVPLLAFASGDLLEETGAVPAEHAQKWALGTVLAPAGSRDDQIGQSPGEKQGRSRQDVDSTPSVGIFPLEYTAPVIAEPQLHRAIHRFKQSAAAADRGELWFLEGDDILVTAMLLPTEGKSGRKSNSWAYGHLVRGARAGAAGLVPLAYLAVPTRQGAIEAVPSPRRSRTPTHGFGQ